MFFATLICYATLSYTPCDSCCRSKCRSTAKQPCLHDVTYKQPVCGPKRPHKSSTAVSCKTTEGCKCAHFQKPQINFQKSSLSVLHANGMTFLYNALEGPAQHRPRYNQVHFIEQKAKSQNFAQKIDELLFHGTCV